MSETLKAINQTARKGESLHDQVKGFLHGLKGQTSNLKTETLENFMRLEAWNVTYGGWEEVICLYRHPPKIECSAGVAYFLADSSATLEGAEEFIANALAHFRMKCGIIEKEVSDMPTSEFSPQIFRISKMGKRKVKKLNGDV